MQTIIKKKTNKKLKEDLLNSLRENDEDEETELETANNATEVRELINHYEEIIRARRK